MSVASATRDVGHRLRAHAALGTGAERVRRSAAVPPPLRWAALALAVAERPSSAAVAGFHSEIAPQLGSRAPRQGRR